MTTPEATHITNLDLDTIPRGSTRRFALEVMRDPLSNPVCIPVMVSRGLSEGPVFGITAAVRGMGTVSCQRVTLNSASCRRCPTLG